jgi:hypothetical protein
MLPLVSVMWFACLQLTEAAPGRMSGHGCCETQLVLLLH